MGHWHTATDGSQTWLLDEGEELTYDEILSGLVEQRRRMLADPSNRYIGPTNDLADTLAGEFAKRLPDVDPEVVCHVVVMLTSLAGGLLTFGVQPSHFMNIVAMASAKHAGHIPAGSRVR